MRIFHVKILMIFCMGKITQGLREDNSAFWKNIHPWLLMRLKASEIGSFAKTLHWQKLPKNWEFLNFYIILWGHSRFYNIFCHFDNFTFICSCLIFTVCLFFCLRYKLSWSSISNMSRYCFCPVSIVIPSKISAACCQFSSFIRIY